MSNDLISREALKRAFEDTVCIEPMPYAFVKQIIDNAPTVFSCNACKNMGNEQECVDCHDYSNYVHYDERPQGEWIMDKEHTSNSLLWYKCNKCGVYHSPTNFCPSCGADMRKGGAE